MSVERFILLPGSSPWSVGTIDSGLAVTQNITVGRTVEKRDLFYGRQRQRQRKREKNVNEEVARDKTYS